VSPRPTRDALLASAPASVRARNGQPSGAAGPLPPRPVAPPAPAKRPGRGSARPVTPGALDAAAGVVVVELPGLRLRNPLNERQHWRTVHARGQREKAAVAAVLRGRVAPTLPVDVVITRVSPGVIADDDGATASAKHVRDEVSRWLGVDDGDRARVRFVVAQAKGAAAVRIAVGPRVTRRALCPACGCAVDVGEGSEGR
jgi:hypothetical protein